MFNCKLLIHHYKSGFGMYEKTSMIGFVFNSGYRSYYHFNNNHHHFLDNGNMPNVGRADVVDFSKNMHHNPGLPSSAPVVTFSIPNAKSNRSHLESPPPPPPPSSGGSMGILTPVHNGGPVINGNSPGGLNHHRFASGNSGSPSKSLPVTPLKINIPESGDVGYSNSPFPSPTGTIRYVYSRE